MIHEFYDENHSEFMINFYVTLWSLYWKYLIANPTSKFMMIIEHNKTKSTKATWVVGLPSSGPIGINKSPKLNSPTIIAKTQHSEVSGSLKCSYEKFW